MAKITILGNGAIGMHQAFAFALAGNEVTVLGRPNSQKIPALWNEGNDINLSCPDIDDIISFINAIEGETLTVYELREQFNLLPHFQKRLDTILGAKDLNLNSQINTNAAKAIITELTTIKAVRNWEDKGDADIAIKVVCDEHEVDDNQNLIVTTVKADALNASNGHRLNNIMKRSEKTQPRIVVAANGMMPWVSQDEEFEHAAALNDVLAFANEVGRENVIGMVLSYAASITGGVGNPGFVRLASRYNETNVPIGDAVDLKDDYKSLKEVAEIYNDAGMNCSAEEEGVSHKMLTKLGVNMANPVTAIFGMNYQKAMDNPLVDELIKECTAELFDVITELKLYNHEKLFDEQDFVKENTPTKDIAKQKFVDHTTSFMMANSEHRTSTLVDIDNLQSTEAAYIIGAVVGMANNKGIDVPVLQKVNELLAAVEACATHDQGNGQERVEHFRGQLSTHLELDSRNIDAFLDFDLEQIEEYQTERPLPEPDGIIPNESAIDQKKNLGDRPMG